MMFDWMLLPEKGCDCYASRSSDIMKGSSVTVYECRRCDKRWVNYQHEEHAKRKYAHILRKKQGLHRRPRVFRIECKDNKLYFEHVHAGKKPRGKAMFDLDDNNAYVMPPKESRWRRLSTLMYYFRDYSFRRTNIMDSIPLNDWYLMGNKPLAKHIHSIMASLFDQYHETSYSGRYQKRPHSPASFLPYIRNLWYHKEWNDTGITCHHMIGVGVKAMSKKARKLMVTNKVVMTKDLERMLLRNRTWTENFLYTLENERIPTTRQRRNAYATESNIWQEIVNQVDEFWHLHQEHGYDAKDIIRYIYNYLIPYENIDVNDAMRFLRDYASMNKAMEVADYKRFPKYLKSKHDIIANEFRNYEKKHDLDLFKKHLDTRLALERKDFHVLVPAHPDDLKFEGKMLSHCVGSYIDRIVRGETMILFLRRVPEQPLVTLELRDEVIIQAKGYANRNVTKEEQEMIQRYAKEKNLVVRI